MSFEFQSSMEHIQWTQLLITKLFNVLFQAQDYFCLEETIFLLIYFQYF